VPWRILTLFILLAAPFYGRSERSFEKAIPFVYQDDLIWVEVSVPQSSSPLRFLLDSGASVSVLSLDAARRLQLHLGKGVEVNGVGSAGRGYWPQRMAARAGDIALPRQYLVLDLAGLSNACAAPVDGLIGADFFRNRTVQIDFEARLIRIFAAGTKMPQGMQVELKQVRGAYLVPVAINEGQPQWLRVDTGCNSSLQWVSGAIKDHRSQHRISIALSELDIPMTCTTVQFGDQVLDAVPTGLHERAIFDGEDGLLGNGLLSRFSRVTFNVRARKLVLERAQPGPSSSP